MRLDYYVESCLHKLFCRPGQTVLADLTARIYAVDRKMNGDADPLTLVFVNTGLEYPEIQRFTKEYAEWLRTTYEIPVNLVPLAPELTFPQVLTEYGYPVISKEVAKTIYYARRGSGWALKQMDGKNRHGKIRFLEISRFSLRSCLDNGWFFERFLGRKELACI